MANELQHADLDLTPDNGAFKLRYVSTETADIAFDANAGTIQAALEAVLGSGNVVVDLVSDDALFFDG